MKFFALLLPICLSAAGVHAENATRLGELRTLLQQKPPVFKAPAADPALHAGPAPRQLSVEERAELRRQLTEFRRPAGKGS
jgi:hypothetical protein